MTRFIFVLLLSLGATVSRSPFCHGAEAAQEIPPMPPPGNPDHKEPPEGAFCNRSPHPARSCKCHAICVEDAEGKVTIQEDPKCRAWCFKKHCHCPAECD